MTMAKLNRSVLFLNTWKTNPRLLSFRQTSRSPRAPFSTVYGTPQGRNAEDRDGESIGDKAKETVVKATEVAESVGDTAKTTLDSAWRATKETTQQIKHKFSDSDADVAKGSNHNVGGCHDEVITSVEDLRRRVAAGGFDTRNRNQNY